MKKGKLTLCIFLLTLLASCNKEKVPQQGSNSETLLDPSTGWIRLGTIAHSTENFGQVGRNAMIPYDLSVLNNDLAFLYSENYVDPSGVGVYRVNFKTKINPGTFGISETTAYYEKTRSANYCQFIPGTFTPIFFSIMADVHTATDTAGKILANFDVGNTFRPINLYPDGGISMGGKQNGLNQSDAFFCQLPIKNSEWSTFSRWHEDSTTWLQTSAFRLEGQSYELVVSSKGNRVYFSVIENDRKESYTTEHNFTFLTREEIPGLIPTDFPKDQPFILASSILNNQYTVLLGKVLDDGAAISKKYIGEVSCFQWNRISNSFTQLYGHIAVPKDIGHNFYNAYQVGTEMPDLATIKFTPDGTAYTLCEVINAGDKTTAYTALATVNEGGTKISGKYIRTNNPGDYDQFGLGVCQYFNGSYYAIAYPKNDVTYQHDDPKYRMELVKINP